MELAAFAAFYQSTCRGLWAYVVKCTGRPALADDITQEAYLRMLGALRRGSRTAEAKAYLYRIATNLMRDHWRESRHEEPVRPEVAEQPTAPTSEGRMVVGLDVDEAFGRLPPRQRALLWLAYVEGHNHRDIARALGIRERSVRVLLFRARNRLQDLLNRRSGRSEGAP